MTGLAPWAKSLVAAVGAAALAIKEAAVALPPGWDTAVTIAIAVTTALGVYKVENAPLPKRGVHAVEES